MKRWSTRKFFNFLIEYNFSAPQYITFVVYLKMGLVNNFKKLTLFTFSTHSVVRCAIYLSTCRLLSKLSLNRNLYLCLCTRLVRFLEVPSDMSHIFSFLLSFKDFPFFWNNGSYYGSYFLIKFLYLYAEYFVKKLRANRTWIYFEQFEYVWTFYIQWLL